MKESIFPLMPKTDFEKLTVLKIFSKTQSRLIKKQEDEIRLMRSKIDTLNRQKRNLKHRLNNKFK